jgi:competence protein ComEC
LLATHFGIVSPVAPLANLLLVPLAPMLVLVALAATVLSTVAAAPAQVLLDGLHGALEGLSSAVSAAPGACFLVPVPSPAASALSVMLLALAVLLPRSPGRLRLALAAAATLCLLAPPSWAPRSSSVTVLDTGHGLAVLLDSGKSQVLVDAGGRGRGIGDRVLLPALRARGALTLDAVIVSHEDVDHLNALEDLLVSVRPGALVVGESFGASPPARRVVDSARGRGVPVVRVRAGDSLRLPGLHLDVLQPAAAGGRENDDSLVLRARLPASRVLLPGDLEDQGMARLLMAGQDLRVDVGILPHHGSAGADLRDALAAACDAGVFVGSGSVPAGAGEVVVTPRPAVVLWTARLGAVILPCDGSVVPASLPLERFRHQ